MLELPLVVINVQRGGPSTGLPTKVEQGDLLQALYGRNGESPLPVIAPLDPTDCFDAVIEACRVAIKYMTPVVLLSDAFIANSAEPWRIPEPSSIAPIAKYQNEEGVSRLPYERDTNLARPWTLPGSPGKAYRIGGLEKENLTGNISYSPQNHEKMVHLRNEKVARVSQDIGDAEFYGDSSGKVLLVGFGGTYGSLREASEILRKKQIKVSHLHLRWINPLPQNLATIFSQFSEIVVCEQNLGQLCKVLRAEFVLPMHRLNKVQGLPFSVHEIVEAVENKSWLL